MAKLDLESLRNDGGSSGMDELKVKEAIIAYNAEQTQDKPSNRRNPKNSYKPKIKAKKWATKRLQPVDEFAVECLTEFISNWDHYQRLVPEWVKIYKGFEEIAKMLSFLEKNKIERIVLKAKGDRNYKGPEPIHVPEELVDSTISFLINHEYIRLRKRYIFGVKKTATPPLENVAFWHGAGPKLVENVRVAGFSKKFLAFVVGKKLAALTKALDKRRWNVKDRPLVNEWFQSH